MVLGQKLPTTSCTEGRVLPHERTDSKTGVFDSFLKAENVKSDFAVLSDLTSKLLSDVKETKLGQYSHPEIHYSLDVKPQGSRLSKWSLFQLETGLVNLWNFQSTRDLQMQSRQLARHKPPIKTSTFHSNLRNFARMNDFLRTLTSPN